MPITRLQTLTVALCCAIGCTGNPPSEDNETRWFGAGLVIDEDAVGFEQPISIAVVPEPGGRPKDALYYVAESGGRIRVVTNDRTVHTFADDLVSGGGRRWSHEIGEIGLKGLCLAAEHGYLFATYTKADSSGRRTMEIARFSGTANGFSLSPSAAMYVSEPFRHDSLTVNHAQIGECHVIGEYVYVGVGDGGTAAAAHDPASSLGKILRMTLDGEPAGAASLRSDPLERFTAQSNPVSESGSRKMTYAPRDYVWARGLRNPFGLASSGSTLFVADNGLLVDRLVIADSGANYFWHGTDAGIGFAADVVLAPSIGPAQTDYRPAKGGASMGELLVAGFGMPSRKPGVVVRIPYDMRRRAFTAPPENVVMGVGGGMGIAALAVAKDGFLFAAYSTSPGRSTSVYRARARRTGEKLSSELSLNAETIIEIHGCRGCHRFRGGYANFGPVIDPEILAPRLHARLHDPAYEARMTAARRTSEPNEAARELAGTEGRERVETWLRHFLRNPRFEDARVTMPTPSLSPEEAAVLATYLSERPLPLYTALGGIADAVLPDLRYRHLIVALLVGWLIGAATIVALRFVVRRGRERR